MLNNKIALVTGASKGIGAEIALDLAQNGAFVYINANTNQGSAELLQQRIQQLGGQAEIIVGSVINITEVTAMFERIKTQHQRLDILVNNAGITRDGLLMHMSEADWEQVLTTNLTSVYRCAKAALPLMISQKAGRIINISSISGLRGSAGQGNYSAAKAGVIALTRSLACEVARLGILVNAVVPGFIATDMLKKVPPLKLTRALSHCLLQRAGKVEEVAAVVTFLASASASYIQGQAIVVDGGIMV